VMLGGSAHTAMSPLSLRLMPGWSKTPYVTANWEKRRNERWTVPVGGGVGKIVHLEKPPVNVYTQLFRNVESPDGTTHWSARIQVQFLFPKR
jgi:hypothetical protein